ncbi:MAG: hypothetical protein H0X69_00030 [Gemmatimonadales bacterium]|nr:hypothetical protein [Gemmatimonadales bacterium]
MSDGTLGRWTAADLRYAAIILLVAVGLWLPRLQGPLDLRYDAGVYYILGTSLAEGRGYRLLNEPGAIEAIQYPPVLPAIAALHQRVLGTSDPVVVGRGLRFTAALLFIGYALAVFALARRLLSPGFAFVAALLAILNAQALFLSDYFAADLPYTALSVFFFLAPPGLGAGALAVGAFGLRTAGVALLGAWAAESLLRREFRQAAARGAVALAAVAGWQAYVHHVKSDPAFSQPAYSYQRAGYQFYNVGYLENMSYVDPFRPELGTATRSDLAARLTSNLSAIPGTLGEAATLQRGWLVGEVVRVRERFPGVPLPDWTISAVLGLLSAMVIGGLVLLARRRQWLLVLYVAGSVLLIATTPWPGQFGRYLTPLAPILALALVSVPAALTARARRSGGAWWRAASLAGIATLGFVLVQQVYTVYKVFTKHHQPAAMTDAAGRVQSYRLFFYDRTWQLHDDALDWLAKRGPAQGIVATSTPHLAYLRTGLPAVMPPYEIDQARAQDLLEEVPVTYLIVDQLSFLDVARRYAAPVAEARAAGWPLVYAVNDSGPRIYRRAGTTDGPSIGSNSIGSK